MIHVQYWIKLQFLGFRDALPARWDRLVWSIRMNYFDAVGCTMPREGPRMSVHIYASTLQQRPVEDH